MATSFPTSLGPATSTYAETLSEFCSRLSWAGFDDAVRECAKELLLDYLGVAIAGQSAESTVAVRTLVDRLRATGTASVIGQPAPTSAEWAALANGTGAHAVEMDDCTRESSLHPGAAVISAGLAAAEESQAKASSLLEGIVSGYEVTMRVGGALNPASAYQRGFHPTGIAGVFGAAMAAGRIIQLSPRRLVSALGIAGGMSSGSLEYLSDGSWTKRLAPGWAAHAGVVAAKLAAVGYTGPATVLEGPLGFLRAYSDDPQPGRLLDDLGAPLAITRVAIKPYACCRYAHGVIDAVLKLRDEYDLCPADVSEMHLGILSIGWDLVANPIDQKSRPHSIIDAQFSAPYAAAVALVRGNAGLGEFSTQNLVNPEIRRLMTASRCYTDLSLDACYPQTMPAAVALLTTSGRTLQAQVDYPAGEPESPLAREELLARFIQHARPILSHDPARMFGRRVLELGSAEDLSFMRAVRGSAHRTTDRDAE